MNIEFIIGMLGAVLTTIAFLPQVIKAHHSHHTKDLSLLMYVLFSIGLIMWLIYGLMLFEIPIICANSVTLVFALYIVYLKVING